MPRPFDDLQLGVGHFSNYFLDLGVEHPIPITVHEDLHEVANQYSSISQAPALDFGEEEEEEGERKNPHLKRGVGPHWSERRGEAGENGGMRARARVCVCV